jgi:hypothetical protein
MRGSQAGYDGGPRNRRLYRGLRTEMADMGTVPEAYTLTVLERRFGDRREITSDGQGAPVTLGYSEVVISPRELRYLVLHVGSAGPVRGFCEPHRNPTTPRHGGRPPQESHGLNGTLRYTCYAC